MFSATEIQNIQVADGNVSSGVSIPIYMIFPRLFSCCTTKTANFKIGKYEFDTILDYCFDYSLYKMLGILKKYFSLTLFKRILAYIFNKEFVTKKKYNKSK